MRTMLLIAPITAALMAVAVGCSGRKADPDAGKVPLEVKVAEARDSTRLEPAAIDSLGQDSTADRSQHADSAKKRPLRFR